MITIPRLPPRTRLLLAAATCAVSITSVQAATVTAVHSFDANPNSALHSDLVLAGDGNFYGTTDYEGANQNGTVFKVTPGGALTVLHTFNALSYTDDGTPDGAFGPNAGGGLPFAGLAQGGDGSFYGTTQYGGANGTGTLFKVTSAGACCPRRNLDVMRAWDDGTDKFRDGT